MGGMCRRSVGEVRGRHCGIFGISKVEGRFGKLSGMF